MPDLHTTPRSGPLRLGFAIPGDLATPTGGYRYDRMVMAQLAILGIHVEHVRLPESYPFPDETARRETARLITAAPVDLWLVDGLAFGAFGSLELGAFSSPVVALVHHALCDETGLSAETSAQLLGSERRAVQGAAGVIVTSQATAERIAALFGLDAGRIAVAEPGVDIAAPHNKHERTVLSLLSVGSVSPRKGYDQMVASLEPLRGKGWHWTIVGRLDDEAATRQLRQRISEAGLDHHITLLGAVDDVEMPRLWASHDALVFPSRYEGYGMVLTEAIANGLSVLVSDRVPAATGLSAPAVVSLAVDDRTGWSRHLASWLDQPETLDQARAAARQLANSLPRWIDTASRIAETLIRIHKTHSSHGPSQ